MRVNVIDVSKHNGVIDFNQVKEAGYKGVLIRAGFGKDGVKQKDPYFGAPTILLVLVPRGAYLGTRDGSAVLTNLCNGAHAAGLGSCWVNRPQFMFETTEGRAMLRRWSIEGDWVGVGSVALGYPAVPAPKPLPRKENYCIIVR